MKSISASDPLKSFAVAFCALFFLTSCKVAARDGLILMTDRSYKATVFATNKIGFGAPDGLCWYQGKLYLADEGAGALQVWSTDNGMKTLLDRQFGARSPEDVVVDTSGNLFFSDDDAGGVWEVDAEGKQHLLAGKDKGLYSTEGIAIAPDASIIVGDTAAHQLFKITQVGRCFSVSRERIWYYET